MAALPPPPGIYVPVPTFFVSHNAPDYDRAAPPIDLATQAAHAIYLAKRGIRGLVVLGSTGEAVALTAAERTQILLHLRGELERAGFHDYPIVAGTATMGLADTLRLLRDAKAAGAQWGMCLAPGYFAGQVTQGGLRAWYEAVADASPIPILIYHYPGVSNNVKLAPCTIAALSQHRNIVGCKLSHGDVSYHAQVSSSPEIDHAHFHTFTGLGQQLLAVLAMGCAGAIDGAAGFFPKSVVHLYALSTTTHPTDDEISARHALQYKLCAVEELIVRYGVVAIKEATSRLRGFGHPHGTRLPLCGGIPGGDEEWETWSGVIAELDEVEMSLEAIDITGS